MTAPGALTGRYSAPGAVRALRLRASQVQFPATAGEGGADPFGTSGHRHPCHPERGGGFRRGLCRRAFLFPPRPRQSPIVAGQQIENPAAFLPAGQLAGVRAARTASSPLHRAPGASRPYHHAQSVNPDRSPAHVSASELSSQSHLSAKTRLSDPRAETVRPPVFVNDEHRRRTWTEIASQRGKK